MFSLEL